MLGSGHYFFQLLATVMSKIVIITTGLPAASKLIETGYAATEVPTTLVGYVWNGVQSMSMRGPGSGDTCHLTDFNETWPD